MQNNVQCCRTCKHGDRFWPDFVKCLCPLPEWAEQARTILIDKTKLNDGQNCPAYEVKP